MVKSWATDEYNKYMEKEREKGHDVQDWDKWFDEFKDNIDSVNYGFMVFALVAFMCATCGCLYRGSTKDRTFKNKEKILQEEQKALYNDKLQGAMDRNADKRAYYENKYPGMNKNANAN